MMGRGSSRRSMMRSKDLVSCCDSSGGRRRREFRFRPGKARRKAAPNPVEPARTGEERYDPEHAGKNETYERETTSVFAATSPEAAACQPWRYSILAVNSPEAPLTSMSPFID